MSTFDYFSFSVESFSGKVRLFPLPNLVLFPHVMQPLHIFELRYRDLLEDALAGDRLIAMSVLVPGWERNYEGRPRLHPMACLSRITTHCRLSDGTYNVLLLGLRRVRLLRELARRGGTARPMSNYAKISIAAALCLGSGPCNRGSETPLCKSCRRFPTPASSWTSCWETTCR